MTWLLTSDTHLSDRPKDQYRFGLFDWLTKQQQKYNVDATFLLGDLTDRKDNHSALLVNKIINSLLKLKPPVYILMGNHDFIDPSNPFFEFLNCVEGIEFINEPTVLKELGVALLPHQPDQASFDRVCSIVPLKAAAVCLHIAVEGAVAESGVRLSGLSTSAIEAKRPGRVWAGDVHSPQQCGCVTYIGAPYQIRFTDTFTPRVLLFKDQVEQNLYFPTLHKWVLRVRDADEILNNVNLQPKDQVKLVLTMAREEIVEWSKYKQRVLDACKERQVEVFGVTLEVTTTKRKRQEITRDITSPEQVLDEFCKNENVASNIKQAGVELLKG